MSSLSGQAAGTGQGAPPRPGAPLFARRVPLAGFGTVRERIQTMFLRTLLKQQGTAWLGRALPFGIGAVVGGVGNRVMGRAVVANAKEAFGPMPLVIPGELGRPAAGRGTWQQCRRTAARRSNDTKDNSAQEGGTFWI